MAMFFGHARRLAEPTANCESADDRLIAALLGYEARLRALRLEIFDSNAINDSSWPLLQDIFAACLNGEKLRTKQVCAMSGLPQTTVLRYLDHLEKLDVIERQDDPDDSRVTLVSMTEAGAFWMREYYTQIISSEERRNAKGKSIPDALRAIERDAAAD